MEVATYTVMAGAVGTIGLAAGSHAAKCCQGEGTMAKLQADRTTRQMVSDSGDDAARIAELSNALKEEEVQGGGAMTWLEDSIQKTKEFGKAEPIEKLQMMESDVGRIKQLAAHQEKLIAEFNKGIEKELERQKQAEVVTEQELERVKQTKAAIERELELQAQAKAAIEQEMHSHQQNAADQRRLVEELWLQNGKLERKLQEHVPTASPETQDALRMAASAEEELALVKRDLSVVQERAHRAEIRAAQDHQEVLTLQAKFSSQPPVNGAEMKQLRLENEQLKADNAQLHTNQDIYERNQHVLQEDNTQLFANQKNLAAQLQAALVCERLKTAPPSLSLVSPSVEVNSPFGMFGITCAGCGPCTSWRRV